MATVVNGKDGAGNRAYISVSKEDGKILVFSSEECGDVVLFTQGFRRESVIAWQPLPPKYEPKQSRH